MSGLNYDGIPQNLKNTSFPFPYNNFEYLLKLVKKRNIGIIKMEVMRNIEPQNNYLKKIRKLKNPSKNLRDYFYIPESKDPDFIIRTGGQIRLSNFMLWQSAYAELYFTKVLWPDFKISNLNRALDQLMKRKRNYGQ